MYHPRLINSFGRPVSKVVQNYLKFTAAYKMLTLLPPLNFVRTKKYYEWWHQSLEYQVIAINLVVVYFIYWTVCEACILYVYTHMKAYVCVYTHTIPCQLYHNIIISKRKVKGYKRKMC